MKKSCIVADGQERTIAFERPRIDREVKARHSREWASAGFFVRIRLGLQIRREIRAELARVAPAGGLYAAHRDD